MPSPWTLYWQDASSDITSPSNWNTQRGGGGTAAAPAVGDSLIVDQGVRNITGTLAATMALFRRTSGHTGDVGSSSVACTIPATLVEWSSQAGILNIAGAVATMEVMSTPDDYASVIVSGTISAKLIVRGGKVRGGASASVQRLMALAGFVDDEQGCQWKLLEVDDDAEVSIVNTPEDSGPGTAKVYGGRLRVTGDDDWILEHYAGKVYYSGEADFDLTGIGGELDLREILTDIAIGLSTNVPEIHPRYIIDARNGGQEVNFPNGSLRLQSAISQPTIRQKGNVKGL